MGMYDTFFGKYICPVCGAVVAFEEQTKQYERMLDEFFLGDYVDRADVNHFYTFTKECPKCRTSQEVALAIRNGQYAAIVLNQKGSGIGIEQIPNIEANYERHRIYERMCAAGIGEDLYQDAEEPKQMHIGDRIFALQAEWTVDEVYWEKLKEDVAAAMRMFYDEAFVYRVHKDSIRRIIRISKNRFTNNVTVAVRENGNLESEEKWTQEASKIRYLKDRHCVLVKIE